MLAGDPTTNKQNWAAFLFCLSFPWLTQRILDLVSVMEEVSQGQQRAFASMPA